MDHFDLSAQILRALKQLQNIDLPNNLLQVQMAGAVLGYAYYVDTLEENEVNLTNCYYKVTAGALAYTVEKYANTVYGKAAEALDTICKELFHNWEEIKLYISQATIDMELIGKLLEIKNKKYKFTWMVSAAFATIIGAKIHNYVEDSYLASIVTVFFGGAIGASSALLQDMYKHANLYFKQQPSKVNE